MSPFVAEGKQHALQISGFCFSNHTCTVPQPKHPGHEQDCAFWKNFAKLRENCLSKKRDTQVLPAGDLYFLNTMFSLQVVYASAKVCE